MSIQPQGEELRKAVKWVSEQLQDDPQKGFVKILEEAGIRFDLSPLDEAFLQRFYHEKRFGPADEK